jgi:hypothetical protein
VYIGILIATHASLYMYATGAIPGARIVDLIVNAQHLETPQANVCSIWKTDAQHPEIL